MHRKCRNSKYLNGPQRSFVADCDVPWTTEAPDFFYCPVEYTAPSVLARPPWADVEGATIEFNCVAGGVNRVSNTGQYALNSAGLPMNPKGRTGMSGRGLLGRFGPNHAGDSIVTRVCDDRLQVVLIKRRDTGEWALPGGMVDMAETVSQTVKREFGEEALNTLEMSEEARERVRSNLDLAFLKGVTIFRGYVDDPRNTDHAWMETTVVHLHDQDGSTFSVFPLAAGDDAVGVRWVDLSEQEMPVMYADHAKFLKIAVKAIEVVTAGAI